MKDLLKAQRWWVDWDSNQILNFFALKQRGFFERKIQISLLVILFMSQKSWKKSLKHFRTKGLKNIVIDHLEKNSDFSKIFSFSFQEKGDFAHTFGGLFIDFVVRVLVDIGAGYNDTVGTPSARDSSAEHLIARDATFMSSLRFGRNMSIIIVRKSNSGVGESFTSDWKLNRQKGCFSELANSLEVTVFFSLQICSIGSRLSKNFK